MDVVERSGALALAGIIAPHGWTKAVYWAIALPIVALSAGLLRDGARDGHTESQYHRR